MFITPDFVFVHMPKTGGTFVTKMLKKLYPDGIELDKHGTCSDIPHKYAHLPIVSVLRNPFDRYVSQYFYGWWQRNLELYCGSEHFEAHLEDGRQNIEKIEFEYFVYLTDKCFKGFYQSEPNGYRNMSAAPLGWHTEQYFRFFFREPKSTFNQLTEADIQSKAFIEQQYPVTFMFNETLNQDLHQLLSDFGHSAQDLAFIIQSDRILPEGGQPRNDRDWRKHYTDESLTFVAQRERILFDLYSQYKEVA